MAKVSFYKLTNTDATALPIREGQVIFVTDTKRLFLDNANNSRIEMTSYNLTQDASDNHILTFTRPDGTSSSYTIPDHIYTGSNHIEIDGENVVGLDDETLNLLYGDSLIEENGKAINLNNVKIEKVNELILSKESAQKTTTGKNKIGLRDGTYTDHEKNIIIKNGIIHFEGDSASSSINYYIPLLNNITLTANKTYTLSVRADNNSVISSANVAIRLLTTNYATDTNSFGHTWKAIGNTKIVTITDTLSADTIYTYAYIYINPNLTNQNFNLYWQVEEGETETIYEPYTGGQASPNPSYPQEVKTVKGYRNLFDKDTMFISGKQLDGTTISDLSDTRFGIAIIPCKPNTTYTLSKLETNVNRIGYSSSYVTEGSVDYGTSSSNTTTVSVTTNNNANYIYVNVMISSDIVARHYTTEEMLNSMQLTEGIIEKPYVPYGTNWVYNRIVGKNLFDKKNATIGGYLNNNNVFVSNQSYGHSDYISVNEGNYYLSGLDSGAGFSPAYCYYDENKSFIEGHRSENFIAKLFNIPSNVKYIRFSFQVANIDTIQLEQGTQTTSYEPYKESIITIPLNNNEIVGIGNYKDELIVDKSGHCWLNKKIGKVVLNGSESGWSYASVTQGSLFRYVSVRSINNKTPMSNYFIGLPNNTNRENGKFYYNNAITGFDFIYNSFDNVNDFKNWLSTHNTEVYYVLETPELIDLNYDVDIRLFKGVNNISNSENADMILLYYNKSINGLYNNLSDRIDSINYIDKNEKGNPGGVGELDENGILLTSQMPSYVDDVLEYNNQAAFPTIGESGKIYVALDTNKTYRWSGTTYTEISPSLALGETSSTAYRGDRGAAAYKHAVTNKGIAALSNLYKIATNSEGHVTNATAVVKSDIVNLGIPGSADQGIKVENNIIKLEDEPYHLLYDDAESNITGESIYIEDALANKIKKLELDKLSTQRTPTYKGLLKIPKSLSQTKNGLTFVVNDDNSVTITGTSTAVTQIDLDLESPITLSGTYTFSLKTVGTISNAQQQQWILYPQSMLNPTVESNKTIKVTRTLTNLTINSLRVYTTANRTLNCTIYPILEEGDTATDWDDMPTNLTPNPSYPQEVKTVKGYRNLLDINKSESGGIDASGNLITNQQLWRGNEYIEVNPNQDYTFTNIEGLLVRFYQYDENKNFISPRDESNNNNKKFTIKMGANTKYIKWSLYNNGTTLTKSLIETYKLQLVEGTEKFPYVPYRTNWIYTKVTGKNLFDKDNPNIFNSYYSSNSNSLVANAAAKSIYIKIKPNTTYTISKHEGHTFRIATIVNAPANGVNVIYTIADHTTTSITITTSLEAKYLWINYYNQSNGDDYGEDNMKNTIQVEEGQNATTFESYKENIFTIPLNDDEIAGIGDYKDELIVDKNGKCWLNKKIGKMVFNGSENWTSESILSTLNTQRLRLNNAINTIGVSTTEVANIMTNLYTPISADSLWNGNVGIAVASGGTNLFIYDTNYNTGNVNDFKSMLSNNNLVIYYPLVTHELIDLNYTVDIRLFNGVNNIFNSEDANMSITYLNDSINGKYQQFIDITGLIGNDLDIINGEEV